MKKMATVLLAVLALGCTKNGENEDDTSEDQTDLPDPRDAMEGKKDQCDGYDDDGTLRRIVNDWVDSGIPARPHIVTSAPFLISAGDDGMRRLHPTRELDRYFEIGAPYVKVGGLAADLPRHARQNRQPAPMDSPSSQPLPLHGRLLRQARHPPKGRVGPRG